MRKRAHSQQEVKNSKVNLVTKCFLPALTHHSQMILQDPNFQLHAVDEKILDLFDEIAVKIPHFVQQFPGGTSRKGGIGRTSSASARTIEAIETKLRTQLQLEKTLVSNFLKTYQEEIQSKKKNTEKLFQTSLAERMIRQPSADVVTKLLEYQQQVPNFKKGDLQIPEEMQSPREELETVVEQETPIVSTYPTIVNTLEFLKNLIAEDEDNGNCWLTTGFMKQLCAAREAAVVYISDIDKVLEKAEQWKKIIEEINRKKQQEEIEQLEQSFLHSHMKKQHPIPSMHQIQMNATPSPPDVAPSKFLHLSTSRAQNTVLQ